MPDDIVQEAKIAERALSNISLENHLGKPAAMSCPECGGPLWQIDRPGPGTRSDSSELSVSRLNSSNLSSSGLSPSTPSLSTSSASAFQPDNPHACGPLRYRCHVGHGFTAKTLLGAQDQAVEQALWAAMRLMEERSNLAATMANNETTKERYKSAQVYQERSDISKKHAIVLRQLLKD